MAAAAPTRAALLRGLARTARRSGGFGGGGASASGFGGCGSVGGGTGVARGACLGPGGSSTGALVLRRSCASSSSSVQKSVARRCGRALAAGFLGIGVAAVAAGSVHFLDDARRRRADEMQAELRAEEAAERRKTRTEEVQRLSSQASVWRLAELVLTLLPLVFFVPVWLFDPSSFWSLVAARIDLCGPTFVKLAQWLSTRRDLFPDSVCEALSGLQNQVSARWSEGLTSSEVADSLRDNEVKIKSIEPKAHASGSIAEVFFAQLEDGTDVAVKCLRPGVRSLLEADLAWLLRFSQLADRVETLRILGVRQATEEFCEHIQMQTDFNKEASHLRRFRANFDCSGEAVRFPAPLFVTPEALVLTREAGEELANIFKATPAREVACSSSSRTAVPGTAAAMTARAEALRQALGISADLSGEIARQTMAAYMRMIFCNQFIHGDLHPGNIMLLLRPGEATPASSNLGSARGQDTSSASVGGGLLAALRERLPAALGGGPPKMPSFELVILDAGLAIPLPREKVEVLRSLAIAIIYADFYRAADILYQESPDSSRCWDPHGFKMGLAKAFEACRRNVWEEGFVQVSDACLEALHLVQYYNVGLDTTLTWTLFGMLSVEGSAKQLDPSVDCAQAANRYIITLPSLIREMRHQSPETIKHMVSEMAFKVVGLNYWDWRVRNGRTWRDLQTA